MNYTKDYLSTLPTSELYELYDYNRRMSWNAPRKDVSKIIDYRMKKIKELLTERTGSFDTKLGAKLQK